MNDHELHKFHELARLVRFVFKTKQLIVWEI